MINLLSDTVTKPTQAMREVMFSAEVGDDVFQQDPTAVELETYAANLLGMEAGLFCPSGVMANQIAINLHTNPLDEVLCDKTAHIYNYEAGAWAMHSGVSIRLLNGKNGIITSKDVEKAIQPKFDWLPVSRLLVIENTCNKAGGTHYTLQQIKKLTSTAENHQLHRHLDGARLFNALCVTGEEPKEYGACFDTISFCLSKGLGAPVGSMLLGSADSIAHARRIRKALGGGMRQIGFLAAAGLHALKNHRQRLAEDHQKANLLRNSLLKNNSVEKIRPGETNIVIFDLDENYMSANTFIEKMKAENILCAAFGPQTIRLVTHMDVTRSEIQKVCQIIEKM
ncbi:MAG: aminotransferase class I/II-fold pyridoxal phosphate-dependent enzyme [Bacteroidetes bacterium]|nr:aminotransferase class I/II-fold pyridoxal phosphate-dependent enzyme [Bacteroidota bacterium]